MNDPVVITQVYFGKFLHSIKCGEWTNINIKAKLNNFGGSIWCLSSINLFIKVGDFIDILNVNV